MGGIGSGTWVRCNCKDTVESHRTIDIRYLRHKKALWPGCAGILRWYFGGSERGKIKFRVFSSKLILMYCYRSFDDDWENVEQHIYFSWTPCFLGGRRQWFLCPVEGCGRRVAVLYGAGKEFACRHCYGLVYQSQRESSFQRVLPHSDKGVKRIERGYLRVT